MACRNRLISSDYSENMSDATTCSCIINSIEKCSLRSCSGTSIMFQEPFFLHPPGSRPRDGLYINPMSAPYPIASRATKESMGSSSVTTTGTVTTTTTTVPTAVMVNGNNSSESFYLHSPRDLVYTRISHLFDDTASVNSNNTNTTTTTTTNTSRASNDRKDDMLTVKVDVHINNNGTLKQHQQPSSPTVVLAAPPPPPPPPPPPLLQLQQQQQLGNGSVKDNGSEHAYEQIFIKTEEQSSPKHNGNAHRKLTDNATSSDHRSNKADRRYSRSSSASESSNMSSEVHCYSSATSTPSLSRNSSNERRSKSPKTQDNLIERKNSTTSSTRAESEKETKTSINGPTSIFRPPPPPPPPPPEIEEVVIVTSKVVESSFKEEKKDGCLTTSTQEQKCESTITISATTTTQQQQQQQQPLPARVTAVGAVAAEDEHETLQSALPLQTLVNNNNNNNHNNNFSSAPVNCNNNYNSEELQNNGGSSAYHQQQQQLSSSSTHQVTAHLVNRHMVLPFIPPKFASQPSDSDTLLKPSEYLRSICKSGLVTTANTASLSKARSVDNLDIRSTEEELNGKSDNNNSSGEEEEEEEEEEEQDRRNDEEALGPPPPPLPPPPMNGLITLQTSTTTTTNSTCTVDGDIGNKTQQHHQQPLATISIQDLTSVQLRRTNIKMHATKTFSAPPNRSVSMTNVSEAFCVQKTDLIAELKKTKDIPGIKKLKVQRAQVEKTQEQTMISEINKAFSIANFVDQIPEKDSSGNVIPIWKRQMLARKAAERAKKELEEQIARENEEKRIQAIPPWKRQLLAKKDSDCKTTGAIPLQTCLAVKNEVQPIVPKKEPVVAVDVPPPLPTAPIPTAPVPPKIDEPPAAAAVLVNNEEKRNDSIEDSDSVHIIPWRAQLRKTNSKLNILD